MSAKALDAPLARLRPVLCWHVGQDTIRAGATWLAVHYADRHLVRVKGTDELLAAGELLDDWLTQMLTHVEFGGEKPLTSRRRKIGWRYAHKAGAITVTIDNRAAHVPTDVLYDMQQWLVTVNGHGRTRTLDGLCRIQPEAGTEGIILKVADRGCLAVPLSHVAALALRDQLLQCACGPFDTTRITDHGTSVTLRQHDAPHARIEFSTEEGESTLLLMRSSLVILALRIDAATTDMPDVS